jgi:hypothetical protein
MYASCQVGMLPFVDIWYVLISYVIERSANLINLPADRTLVLAMYNDAAKLYIINESASIRYDVLESASDMQSFHPPFNY